MLNFDFLEKGLEIVSPLHFVYDFSRKMFFNWLNFIAWLPLLLEILVSMYIADMAIYQKIFEFSLKVIPMKYLRQDFS